MPSLSFRDCRAAARAVRRAEHGAAVVVRLRGERISGFFRPRPGIGPMLYLAAAQDRVMWLSPECFVLLERPLDDVGRPVGTRARLAWRTERCWPYVRDHLPAVGLLAALPLALLTKRYARLVIAMGGLAVSVYILALFLPSVARGMWWASRFMGRALRTRTAPADTLFGDNWSVGLCHVDDPARVEPLLAVCRDRVRELSSSTPFADGVLLCVDTAVTTDAARQAAGASYGALAVPGLDRPMIVMRLPGDPVPPPAREHPIPFLRLYLSGVLVTLAAQAHDLAGRERAACADSSCAGRPTDLASAFLWLLQRAVVVVDLTDVTPASAMGRIYGALAQMLGVTTAVVVGVTFWRAVRRDKEARADTQLALRQAIDDADISMVFISYRQGDHDGVVKAVRHTLAEQLRAKCVFMDYWSIPAGSRYPDQLRLALGRCRVLLVVIHENWLDQLKGPGDWVQYEIRTALENATPILPVYLNDTPFLASEQLPPDISELGRRQGYRLPWDRGHGDESLDGLVDAIRAAVRRSSP